MWGPALAVGVVLSAAAGCGGGDDADDAAGEERSSQVMGTARYDPQGHSGRSHSVSAFREAPAATDEGARRIRADRDQPRMRSLRSVGQVGPSHWYAGRSTAGETCLFATTTSISGSCGKLNRRFTYMTVALPIAGEEQLTAVLVPDAYDRATVLAGAPTRVTQPRFNLLFVEHAEPVKLQITGDAVPRRRVPLRYIGPFGSQ